MSEAHRSKMAAIDRNLEDFLRQLPSLMKEHEGKYALLRDGEVVGFFETAIDAQIAGNQQFEDTLFSLQKITRIAEELGHFTYALDQRTP